MKGLIFTFALTYGGAALSLIKPFVGFLIYVAFAILKPDFLWSFSVPQGGQYSRVVALGLLAGWAANGFGDWNFGRARGVVICLVLFWLWSLVSALNAVASVSAGLVQVEAYSKVFLPFIVGITTIRSIQQVKILAWVIILSQGYLAYEFHLLYYAAPWFNVEEWHFGGLDRNGIAITMVASSGLAFFVGLHSERWWQKLLAIGLAAAMTHVVLFSMSRGGMLALVLTGLITFVLLPKRPIYILIFALAVLAGLRLAGPHVWERFSTTFAEGDNRDYSAQSRVDLWAACLRVIWAHPLTGIGPENWRLVAHLHGFPRGKDAHTLWLHVGAEMGIVGLAFLVSFYGLCCRRLWSLRRTIGLPDPWFGHIASMVITAIAAFAVSAQFVSVYGIELPYYVVLVGCGALKLADSGCADAQDGGSQVSRGEVAFAV